MSSPRANTSSSAGLELERAEREQRRELAGAVAGGERAVVAERAGLAQLGELRRVQRHERRLRELRARAGRRRDGAARGRRRAAARSGCARRRRAARSRAASRVRVGALPDLARGARARAPVGAEPAALHALAAEHEHGPRRRDERLAGRRELAVGEHGHLDDLEAVLQRDARRPQLERPRRARRGDEARSASAAARRRRPSQTASTTNAEARAAVQAPCTIGRARPPRRAASTQRCSGLWSPPMRANASMLGGALSCASASGTRGRGCRAGAAGARRADRGADRMRGVAPLAARRPSRSPPGASPSRSSVPARAATSRRPRAARRSCSRPARAARSPAGERRSARSHGCAASHSRLGRGRRARARRRAPRGGSAARSVTGAAPSIMKSASTVASTPRSPRSTARHVIRVGAPSGSSSATTRASTRPRSPAAAATPGPRLTAWPAWTSCASRAANGRARQQPGERRPGERQREVERHAVVRRRRSPRGAPRRAPPSSSSRCSTGLERIVGRASRARRRARAARTRSCRRRRRPAHERPAADRPPARHERRRRPVERRHLQRDRDHVALRPRRAAARPGPPPAAPRGAPARRARRAPHGSRRPATTTCHSGLGRARSSPPESATSSEGAAQSAATAPP